MLSKALICGKSLYYVVFGSKHIGVSDAQKHFKQV